MRCLIIKMSDWISDTLYSNGTLKNKLNIKDQNKLQEIEYVGSARRAEIILDQNPKINGLKDLRKIHKYMFSFLYDWAGEYRMGNFQKNGYVFFDRDRFDFAEQDINELISNQNQKEKLSPYDYASLLDKLNFMHPFREGNGRATKVFLQAYANQHNQTIEYLRKSDDMIEALNDADVDTLAKLVKVTDQAQNLFDFSGLDQENKNLKL